VKYTACFMKISLKFQTGRKFYEVLYSMGDTICLFGALAVVKPLESAHQVSCNTPDPLKGDGVKVVGDIHKLAVITVYGDVDALDVFVRKLLLRTGHVRVYLLLRERAALDVHFYHCGCLLHLMWYIMFCKDTISCVPYFFHLCFFYKFQRSFFTFTYPKET
jgi:hypothetical protein